MEKNATTGDLYHPAMKITDQKEADEYFEKLVQWSMEHWGKTRKEAEKIQRENLGYFAGYFDDKVRARVERLFRCKHPVFGAIAEKGAPTADEAFLAGSRAGKTATAAAEVSAEAVRESPSTSDQDS
jgi:hypothetical protein